MSAGGRLWKISGMEPHFLKLWAATIYGKVLTKWKLQKFWQQYVFVYAVSKNSFKINHGVLEVFLSILHFLDGKGQRERSLRSLQFMKLLRETYLAPTLIWIAIHKNVIQIPETISSRSLFTEKPKIEISGKDQL